VTDHISRADSTALLASVLQQVDGEHHIHASPERTEVWEKLKISDLLPAICECSKQMYTDLYKEFAVGRDKYAKFQLKWYQHCSSMLADINIDMEPHHCLSSVINRWSDFRNAHKK
jgi:tRNA A37 N6-isopentenylltransferase MiaA